MLACESASDAAVAGPAAAIGTAAGPAAVVVAAAEPAATAGPAIAASGLEAQHLELIGA